MPETGRASTIGGQAGLGKAGPRASVATTGRASVSAVGTRTTRSQTWQPSSSSGGNIKVCVRVRPFNRRETSSNESRCVHVRSPTEVVLTDILDIEKPFNFDRAYDSSIEPAEEGYASQETLMEDLGVELRKNALEGYNSCLFAYGQTGSGKTFSVLGSPDQPGLLPRVVAEVFDELGNGGELMGTYSCSVAYLEIYMEALRDLLAHPGDTTKLEVRNSPQVGVYIQNLKETPVFTKQDVAQLLEFGAKNRMVAATCMNDQSSRSHCIFTLEIRRKVPGQDGAPPQQLRSKLNLVDLAGSERQKRTQAAGGTLKEGAAINQSLSHLANVIFKLAELAEKKGKTSSDHVPFRNSKLTMALMDSLGGNSKTIMIAALSPAEINYDETLSTLQFAKRVKVVKTAAKRNAESEGSLVARLKAECEQLKAQISKGQTDRVDNEQIEGLEALVEKYGQNLESQLELAQKMQEKRAEALEDLGLTSTKIGESLGLDESTPQLVNISCDPSLVGCLVYFLTQGDPIALGSTSDCKIRLNGLGMKPTMAVIHNLDNLSLTIEANEGRVLLNGKLVRGECPLKHCDRLILGHAYCFRVMIPRATQEEARHVEQMHDLEVALAEVVPQNSDSYEKCKFYVRELQDRIGQEKAQSFLHEFGKVLTQVEEANAITAEVRPCEGLRFSAEVLVDLFHYHEEEPEVVIRLKRVETGWSRLRTIIRKTRMTRTMVSMGDKGKVPELSRSMTQTLDTEEETYETVAVLDTASFDRRLAKLRAIYGDWACDRNSDADSETSSDEGSDEDPFGEVHDEDETRRAERRSSLSRASVIETAPRRVGRVREEETQEVGGPQARDSERGSRDGALPRASAARQSRLSAVRKPSARRSVTSRQSAQASAPQSAPTRRGSSEISGLNDSLQEHKRLLEDEKKQHKETRQSMEADRSSLEERVALQQARIARLELEARLAEDRESRIAELELQLKAARAAQQPSQLPVSDSAEVRRRNKAFQQRLRKDGAELVEAARLASKLLKGIQGVRQDLRCECSTAPVTPRRDGPEPEAQNGSTV